MNRHDPHPAMDDLDADVNLATFPLPDDPRTDGFVEPGESEIAPFRDAIEALKWSHVTGQPLNREQEEQKRRNRDATPCPIPYPNREGESL